MDKMNEKEIQKIDILSVLVLSILILQSILIILLLNSMRNLNVQVGLLMQSSASSQNSTSNLLIGKPYIDFALVDSNGNNFIFSNHLNKPTLLVFSNHQCSACQKMYPELRNFIVNNPQTDVVIIASNSQEQNMEFIQTFDSSISNVIVLQGTQQVFELYGVSATPTFFSLDSTGRIIRSGSVMTEKQIVELMHESD